MAENSFDARLDLVPQSPGVYLMKDAAGSVIYVGKAVLLRNRLRSYFSPNPQGNAKVLAMISHIADFSYIVCENELEALILEANLIKEHHPRYNILLRDDKGYPYIRITMNETYPRLLKAFRIGSDRKAGARYFGPYLAGDLYRALDALRHIFPTKTCRRVLPRDIGKERPCLNYYIGRCVGPCRGDVPVERYRSVMEDICRFLEGRYSGILENLEIKMSAAADQLDYEQAAVYRDRIQSLNKLMEKQKAVSEKEFDADIIGIARNGTEVCLQKLEVREGRIVGSSAFFLPDDQLEDNELLAAFVSQHYPDAAMIPPEILLPSDLSDEEALTELLRQFRGGRVHLLMPQRGAKKQLLDMARFNAGESLQRHTLMGGSGQTALQASLKLLAEKAAADRALHRIEAYDISNIGRDDMVGSMIVFAEGRPARQQYRHYKIKLQDVQDDYQAMREMLQRRLSRIGDDKFGSRPDLILVDGGQGHVNMAVQLIAQMELSIPVAGMVKDNRHRTRGLALPGGHIVELADKLRLHRSIVKSDKSADKNAGKIARKTAEATDRNISKQSDIEYTAEDEMLWRVAEQAADFDQDVSDQQASAMGLLRLLTAIQDEAHRFAITYQRKLSSKRHTKFSLECINGLGPARRRLGLHFFGSIKAVGAASLEELEKVQGLGVQAARAVFEHFHGEVGE